MSLVFTQADLDNLKAAYASGASKVQIGDRTVEYVSQEKLLAAIANVQAYLDGVSTNVDDNPNIVRPTFSKGES